MPANPLDEQDNQLEFFGGTALELVQKEELAGNWTGERLKKLRPEVYRGIIEGLAHGMPQAQLARMYKISRNSVAAIVFRESVVIEQVRQTLGRRATVLYAQLLERIADDLDNDIVMSKTSFKDKVVASNILNEQWRVDAGMPTQIREERRVDVTDINDKFLAALDGQAAKHALKIGFGGVLPGQRGLVIDGCCDDADNVSGADTVGNLTNTGDSKSPVSSVFDECLSGADVDDV